MFDHRQHPRQEASSPVSVRCGVVRAEGHLLNLSPTGACFRLATSVPLGAEAVGQSVTLTSWGNERLPPAGRVVRFAEEPEGKSFGVHFDAEA